MVHILNEHSHKKREQFGFTAHPLHGGCRAIRTLKIDHQLQTPAPPGHLNLLNRFSMYFQGWLKNRGRITIEGVPGTVSAKLLLSCCAASVELQLCTTCLLVDDKMKGFILSFSVCLSWNFRPALSVSFWDVMVGAREIDGERERDSSENSRRLWLFPGSVQEFCRKVPGKLRENCWTKISPNREMLQILGFRAPGKANLPETLGPHCRDLVPTFRAGCFLKSTV